MCLLFEDVCFERPCGTCQRLFKPSAGKVAIRNTWIMPSKRCRILTAWHNSIALNACIVSDRHGLQFIGITIKIPHPNWPFYHTGKSINCSWLNKHLQVHYISVHFYTYHSLHPANQSFPALSTLFFTKLNKALWGREYAARFFIQFEWSSQN